MTDSPSSSPAGSVLVAPDGYQGGCLSPNSRIIVSCDIGNHYPEDFAVTRENCGLYCSDAWRLYFSDYPAGCPKHSEMQYAFKIHCVEEAIRLGFRHILWMDSSLAPIAPITPLWQTIERCGYYAAPSYNGIAMSNGWRQWGTKTLATLGEWCSDNALSIFGISREEAFSIPLALTGLVGLDTQSPIAQTIWRMHKAFYSRGVFNGAHANIPGAPLTSVGGGRFKGHVSHHPLVQGHRHDETSLSYVLHALGLQPMDRGFWTLESEQGFIGQFVKRYGITYKGKNGMSVGAGSAVR